MHNAARVSVVLVGLTLAACHGEVQDARFGKIELVLEPVQRASAPDATLELEHVRKVVARRLTGLPVRVDVDKEGGRLLVTLRGDAGPELVSRARVAVLTQGLIELRMFDGNTFGPTLVDNGGIRDARVTSVGESPGLTVRFRHEAAKRFEAATRPMIGRLLFMMLDDRVIAGARIETPFEGTQIRVTPASFGNHPRPVHEIADTLVLVLNGGEPLPVPLRLLQERRVPPETR